jgi:Ca2+-binding RTX toxin-like protein
MRRTFECLEARAFLAFENFDWFRCGSGQLFLDGNAADDAVTIGGASASSPLLLNGVAVPDVFSTCGIAPLVRDVTSILIQSGRGDDTIDLRQVTTANGFGNLSGDITIDGQDNNDTIHGSPFDDDLFGGSGDDTIFGYDGHDELHGNGEDDVLNGGAGNDILKGGRDLGGVGGDRLFGGAGDDTYVFDAEANGGVPQPSGVDAVFENVGEGTDAFDFTNFPFGVNLNLASTAAQLVTPGAAALTLTINNIATFEDIYAPRDVATNDVLIGNTQPNLIHGYGGDDAIDGDGGDDAIDGDGGDDRLEGGNGRDRIHGGTGNDVINGGDGDDNLMVAPETASLFGDDGNDYVNGDGFADAVASTLALQSPTNATGDFALVEASGLVVSRGTDNGTPTGNRVLWTIQDGGAGYGREASASAASTTHPSCRFADQICWGMGD